MGSNECTYVSNSYSPSSCVGNRIGNAIENIQSFMSARQTKIILMKVHRQQMIAHDFWLEGMQPWTDMLIKVATKKRLPMIAKILMTTVTHLTTEIANVVI